MFDKWRAAAARLALHPEAEGPSADGGGDHTTDTAADTDVGTTTAACLAHVRGEDILNAEPHSSEEDSALAHACAAMAVVRNLAHCKAASRVLANGEGWLSRMLEAVSADPQSEAGELSAAAFGALCAVCAEHGAFVGTIAATVATAPGDPPPQRVPGFGPRLVRTTAYLF